MKVLIVSADLFEDVELLFPYYRLLEEGIEVQIASTEAGTIRGKHGYRVSAAALADIETDGFDLLILPGGKAPGHLRAHGPLLELVRHFMAAGKVVAAICHGPQVLAAAGVLSGRTLTCYRSVATEVTEAGGRYVDQPVVVDGNLITSRVPDDLPVFMGAIMARCP